jgi:phosphoribosylformylglycinamidine synthase subunit PurL
VPLREDGMEPFEIMISESQERMLCVVEPRRLDDVLALCAKWEVRATPIGDVTDTRRLRVFAGEALVGDMPVEALVDDCPLYDLEPAKPSSPMYAPPERVLADDASANETLMTLLGSSNVASKRWAFEQYDSIVGSRTVRRPEAADAAVLTLAPDGGSRALAVSIDGNGRRVACDPYAGAVEAVLECASNLACVGAEPLGLTNCLNFGNPEKAHIAWQLTEAVKGLADACEGLGVPVVGGNVSLYNEAGEGPIYPTPVVGMVGELPDPERAGGVAFRREGDQIALLGPFSPSLAGSELEKLRGGLADGLQAADLALHAKHLALVREAVRGGAVSSAHDVSEGGLACALAECCIAGGIGARVDLAPLASRVGDSAPPEAALFGEGPGGVVVSGTLEAIERLAEQAGADGLIRLGEVGGEALELTAGVARLCIPVEEAKTAYERGLPDRFS